MYMEDIAGREDAGDVGFQGLIDDGAAGNGAHLDARAAGQLVLRDQAAGKQECVALIADFCAGNRLAVLYFGNGDRFDTLFAFDVYYCMGQLQRNAEVIQTLYDISLQTAGIRHQLGNDLDLGAFQSHTSCHDQSDITGTQDHDFTSGHIAFDVNQTLGGTCGINARGTIAGDVQGAAGTLSAAHGQDHGAGLDLEHAVRPVHGGDYLIMGDIHDHGVQLVFNAQIQDLVNETGRVFGTGQLLFEGVQAETVMDTLVQDAAKFIVTLQNQD